MLKMTGFGLKSIRGKSVREKAMWAVLITFCVLFFVSYTYNDILITTRHSINLWNAILEGKFFSFYTYNVHVTSGNLIYTVPQNAIYSFPMYLVFALWNFPLWVMEKLFHADVMNSLIYILWAKTMLLFFLGLSVMIIRKICTKLDFSNQSADACIFFYLSSAFVFSTLFVMSQYDIIGLTFILMGFLMYLNRDMKRFVLWFSIAVAFKFFALFAFIPLVLLYEKRISRILAYGIGSIGVTFISGLLFIGDLASREASLFTLKSLNLFLTQIQPIALGNTTYFLVAIMLLFIFCFNHQTKTDDELERFSVYTVFVSFAILFAFTKSNPYWLILIVPFMTLMIFQNISKFKVNLLLEIMVSISCVFSQMIVFHWCFGIQMLQPMLLAKLFGDPATFAKVYGVEALVRSRGFYSLFMDRALPVLLAAFVAGLISMIVINFPKAPYATAEKTIDATALLPRLLIYGSILSLPIIGYLLSAIMH
jgi:hypothetical protein